MNKYKSREFITYSRRDRATRAHHHSSFDKIKSTIFGENKKNKTTNDHMRYMYMLGFPIEKEKNSNSSVCMLCALCYASLLLNSLRDH